MTKLEEFLSFKKNHKDPYSCTGIFPEDKYSINNKEFFEDILRTESWAALPAGWWNPHVENLSLFNPRQIRKKDLQWYSLDEGWSLNKRKINISRLIESWDDRDYNIDEFTLCTSVSASTLLILMSMKSKGVKNIFFETPSYFGSIEQAKLLGLNVNLIPTYIDNDFKFDVDSWCQAVNAQSPAALWITQPRFALGCDQEPDRVKQMIQKLNPENILVIDQAAEQKFPAALSDIYSEKPDLIRTRGIFKGLGLNGFRTSVITHPSDWRGYLESVLDSAGVSIDLCSLSNAEKISEDIPLFKAMLKAAREQVKKGQSELRKITAGTSLTSTEIENGYMGSFFLDTSMLRMDYKSETEALLSHCKNCNLPVVLGSSCYFAYDTRWQGVRLNYFTDVSNLVLSAKLLLKFLEKYKLL